MAAVAPTPTPSGMRMRGQSKKMSFLESVLNVVAGFGVAFITQIVVFPLFGIDASISENLAIGGIFTVVSIVRSYALRRLFNYLNLRGA